MRDWAYSWTPRGNLASVTDKLNAANDQLYRYSHDQRLAEAGGAWNGIAYSYDAVGNRTAKSTGNWNGNSGFAGGSGTSAGVDGDPYWNNVSYIAGFEASYADESSSGIVPTVIAYQPDMVEFRSTTAHVGAIGMAVNAENQTQGYINYGPLDEVNFDTVDFTIEGFAKSNYNDGWWWHSILGNFVGGSAGSWSVFVSNDTSNRVVFLVEGQAPIYTTSEVDNGWFHFAVSRNGDVLRIFVNGVMEAKVTGWASKVVGHATRDFVVGGNNTGTRDRWRGYLDELRITKGVGRYDSDASISVPGLGYPRGVAADPDWNSVTYLIGFEDEFADDSPASLAPLLPVAQRPSAAKFGATGLAVNAENQESGYVSYGPRDEINFGTGDFTIEGFAKSNYSYCASTTRSLATSHTATPVRGHSSRHTTRTTSLCLSSMLKGRCRAQVTSATRGSTSRCRATTTWSDSSSTA